MAIHGNPADGREGRAPRHQVPPCSRCGGRRQIQRIGDYIRQECIMCGHGEEIYRPRALAYQINLPPQPDQTVEQRPPPKRRPKPPPTPRPEIPEPELAQLLLRYCDLRQRGFTHDQIRNQCDWPRQYPNMLLAHAAERNMPGSQRSAHQAHQHWLLNSFDAGMDIAIIVRQSASNEPTTRKKLATALDAASGRNPKNLVINGPDGNPGRVSWVDEEGILRHRPFDGPFPPDFPKKKAVQQCKEVLVRLLNTDHEQSQDRAYAMLRIAEAGLQCLDNEHGKQISSAFSQAGMDDDTKRTVVTNLHDHPHVQRILLQRCNIKTRWLTGNRARFLSRRMREFGYSPAVIRNIMEYSGNDPNTYYIIGADYRIPDPEPDMRDKCIQKLRKAGFSSESIRHAFSTLGVPPGGRHPPKKKAQQAA